MEMTARGIAAALTTANTVVIKSPELDPLTHYYYAKAAEYAGFPDGAINIICGHGHEAGVALSGHPNIDQIVYTGSVPTGIAIASAAAQNVVPCILEPKKKRSKNALKTILRLESHLIPFPTPEMAERVEAPTMDKTAKTIAADVGLLASFKSQSPKPIRCIPATNCSTPNPSVWAMPKIVATTATISMIYPKLPSSLDPNNDASE